MKRLKGWLCAMVLLAAARANARAQDTANVSQSDWMWAVSLGVPGWREQVLPEAFTFGVNVTQMNPSRVSGDFAVQFFPYAVVYGALGVVARGGVAFPYRVAPNIFVLPSVGGTAVVAASGVGGGALVGGNAGIAFAVGSKGAKSGLRLGVTWHMLQGLDEPIWLVEVGAGRMPSR